MPIKLTYVKYGMAPQREQIARIDIDKLLTAAGWQVFDLKDANILARRCDAIREFPLIEGQRHLFCNTTFPCQIETIDADAFDFVAATTNQALAAVQVDPYVRPYLRAFLECNYEETGKVASGGVQPNLNLSLVRAIAVPLPPLAEQIQIVEEVERRLSLIRGVEAQTDANLKRAERMRQSILARAFSSPNINIAKEIAA